MSASPEILQRVTALVIDILAANSITVDVQPDARLADIGMTSMDMVNLMLAVEAEFDLTIPQAEITPDNFQSPRSIELMLTRQLQQNVAA